MKKLNIVVLAKWNNEIQVCETHSNEEVMDFKNDPDYHIFGIFESEKEAFAEYDKQMKVKTA